MTNSLTKMALLAGVLAAVPVHANTLNMAYDADIDAGSHMTVTGLAGGTASAIDHYPSTRLCAGQKSHSRPAHSLFICENDSALETPEPDHPCTVRR